MKELHKNEIPYGFMVNSAGHLVPVGLISEIDITRNDLVREIVSKATDLRSILVDFKADTMADIQAFVELSAEKYGVQLGGV